MEIALKPEHERLLEEQVASGEFASADEAVAAALDLLHQRQELTLEEERKLLEPAIAELDRGEYRTLEAKEDSDALLKEIQNGSESRRAARQSGS